MSFNFQNYKKLEGIIKKTSDTIGHPILEKDSINKHIVDTYNILLENEECKSIDKKEINIYTKKYISSNFKVPKVKKVKKAKSKVIKKEVKFNKLDFSKLIKPTYAIDDWKYCYSNDKSIPFGSDCKKKFWELSDKKNTSIWHGKYKYNEENKVLFMVKNRIMGFKQNCDKIMKYIFGVFHILESSGDFEIEIVILITGNDIKYLKNSVFWADDLNWKNINYEEDNYKFINDFWYSKKKLNDKKINATIVLK